MPRRTLVAQDGGLRWASPTITHNRTMPQRWLRWLEVQCRRCETRASLPLDAIRRPRNTPIWKLEPALKCRSCRTPRYSPPVHMIRMTTKREIAPYPWTHPDTAMEMRREGGESFTDHSALQRSTEKHKLKNVLAKCDFAGPPYRNGTQRNT